MAWTKNADPWEQHGLHREQHPKQLRRWWMRAGVAGNCWRRRSRRPFQRCGSPRRFLGGIVEKNINVFWDFTWFNHMLSIKNWDSINIGTKWLIIKHADPSTVGMRICEHRDRDRFFFTQNWQETTTSEKPSNNGILKITIKTEISMGFMNVYDGIPSKQITSLWNMVRL